MSWEQNALFSKARFFFERALQFEREDPQFGLWCAFGLELLARAAVASVSPALLAQPDSHHKHLLYALNRSKDRGSGMSISTSFVFDLCKQLFDNFREEDRVACVALTNRRNDEVHTGAAPFLQYPTNDWLPGFYRACDALSKAQGETLQSILGDEASIAIQFLEGDQNDTKQKVISLIAAHKKVFSAKDPKEQDRVRDAAKKLGDALSHQRHHKTICPACGSIGLLQGDAVGKLHTKHVDGEIVTKQAVAPTSYECSACELRLTGYRELAAGGLASHYTRTTSYTPEEFYGLVNPDDLDHEQIAMDWLREHARDYDNE